MKSRLAVSFGEVADRERKHPGEGASGHLGSSGKEASGIKGARVPGRKVAWAFLGRLTLGPSPVEAVPGRKFSWAFLGQLTLGPGPVGAIGLGQLAKGTELGPMDFDRNYYFAIFQKIRIFSGNHTVRARLTILAHALS